MKNKIFTVLIGRGNLYFRLGKIFSISLGWFNGEPFKLIHLDLFHIEPELDIYNLIDIQLLKFIISINVGP